MEQEHFITESARVVELAGVGVLAVIVAIHTFLSFALELEVSGRWPWQRAQDAQRSSGSAG